MRLIASLVMIAGVTFGQFVTPVVSTNSGTFKPAILERRFTAVEGAVGAHDTNTTAHAALLARYLTNETDTVALGIMATNKTLRLFDPADVNKFIDGSGNKYVISNFWNMTFSSGFAAGYNLSPSQTNYLFTSSGQSFFERPGGSMSPYWRISLSSLNYFPGGFYTWDWSPTTNSLVLNPVVGGASGYAYIRHYSTTNLIATLASQADVGSLTAGLVSTNESRTVRLNTLTVTNKITAADGTTVIIPRTRSLVDSASITAADWENRYLYSSGGRLRVDWEGGILTAYHPVGGYSQSIDWINRALMDSDERTAMAWGDRNLQYPTSGVAADWSVDDVLTINGTLSLSGSLTLGGVTKSEWPAASSGAPAVWTNMLWGAVGTNSTYRMSWDVTNGTFKVEEILP